MSKTKFKSALAATLVALGVAGMASQAEARTYGGTFDPPIANVGFMVGAFTYDQDDACKLVEGVFLVLGSCDPNQSITSLSVDIFDDSPIPVLLTSLTYIPPLTTVPSMFYQHNTLPFAISTGLIGPQFSAVFTGIPLWLQFGFLPNAAWTPGSGLPEQLPNVRLWQGVCDGPAQCNPVGPPLTTAFDVRFFEIPEPGTLALLFGALGACLLARRRSRQS